MYYEITEVQTLKIYAIDISSKMEIKFKGERGRTYHLQTEFIKL